MAGILVIGGGPAGASFATRMAQLGHEVTLSERLAFPRPRLGESLTPGVRVLLQATGAWSAVARHGFPPARDVRVIWAGAEELVRQRDGAEGLIVERGAFDMLLVAHARREGVRVLQPCEVVAQRRTEAGWQVELRHDGGREVLSVAFVADARGRIALAGTARRWMGERTVAVYGYWRGRDLPRAAMVAAGAQCWSWGVPLPDGRLNAQVFLSPATLRAMPGSLAERYRRLLADSPLAAGLAGAALDGDVRAIDATACIVAEPVTPRHIRVGDAALALDPISSSGVQKALQSALSGAIVANTLLERPSHEAAAIDFYTMSIRHAADRHAAWAGTHYGAAAGGRPDPFWTARARPAVAEVDDTQDVPLGEVVRLSPLARLVECPCLGAEFVEMRPALVHPALAEPVAYLGRQPLAGLLELGGAAHLGEIIARWSALMPPATALAIAGWLRRRGVLVPATDTHATDLGAAA